jgi:peptidyl-dipeptidase Dcp
MRRILLLGACALAIGATPAAAASAKPASAKPAPAAAKAKPAANPLLAPWKGPHGGVPAFDKVKVEHFKPAFDAAIAENRREIAAIANNKAAPTFDNTILAMERAGQTLGRVQSVYGVWRSNLSTPEFQKVQDVIEPQLASFRDEITGNARLFARIDAVYNSPAKAKLTPEQQRLVWVYWKNFVRAGAKLDPAAKTRVAEINQRLATLFAKFSQNLQGDEAGYTLFLKESDLAGLPQEVKDAAAAAAEEKGRKGEYAIVNTRSSMDPFLTYSDRRDLREKVWRTYYSRGDNGDARDNNAIITEVLKLRAEKAKLLGFETFAHWKLSDKMAANPDGAMGLMLKVWPAAIGRVREEVADMQAIADKEGKGVKVAAWDYRYYAEKVRKAKYDLDQNEVKPYLQLAKIQEAMFWAAHELYGFDFKPVSGLPVFHADVKTYEVTRAGKHVGYWYFDPYAREGKDSGAWETAYRVQDRIDGGHSVLVSNNSNFIKGKPGEPVLISWDDAETMFHEFGHAIHELSSNVTYPTLAGTNTATDFVEFPSQVNENWVSTPEILSRFLVNAEGKPMPPALVEKIRKASTFNEGFAVTEYLAAALIDMKLHLAGGETIDPDRFEREELARWGMPAEIVMRHRTPQFGHVFSSDDYAAGYYSYLWSEVLDHDAYAAFTEAGGPYDKAVAKRFFDDILSVGNTVDPAEAYRKFRGRDPKIDGYLKSKGFPLQGAGG